MGGALSSTIQVRTATVQDSEYTLLRLSTVDKSLTGAYASKDNKAHDNLNVISVSPIPYVPAFEAAMKVYKNYNIVMESYALYREPYDATPGSFSTTIFGDFYIVGMKDETSVSFRIDVIDHNSEVANSPSVSVEVTSTGTNVIPLKFDRNIGEFS